MIVGFTGTRQGMSLDQRKVLKEVLLGWIVSEFHHGDCTGSDEQAHEVMRQLSFETKIIVHPPLSPKHRAWKQGDIVLPEKAYLDRNKDIVNASQALIGCPKTIGEELRSGTWSTIRYGRQMHKKVVIIFPDGRIEIHEDP